MNKYIVWLLTILLLSGFIWYQISNFNTPYEIMEYGAHGQLQPTGEYTTTAKQWENYINPLYWIKRGIGYWLSMGALLLVVFLFKKSSEK
ncbi:MAG: hypothetical protein KGV58_00365 [Campylobacteraceae bacterium]|nr:hypothetical protein [Campylobacteraceae bacterium]